MLRRFPIKVRSSRAEMFFGIVLLLLAAGVNPASAQGNTTTTPAPATGTLTRLSFLIDGIVYVMQCNVTGLNMSNCSFETDHGLSVTPVTSLPGLTEIPTYIVVMLGFTLALVAVLVGLAAYLVWSRNTGRTSGGGYAPPPEQYGPPPGMYPPQELPPQYYGQGSNAAGRPKIISVNLVQPSLPPDATPP